MATKVRGTRLIGTTYHLNLRVPARLCAAYDLPAWKRGTLRTSDPKEAERKVRAAQVELDQLAMKLDSLPSRFAHLNELAPAERDRTLAEIDANFAALPLPVRAPVEQWGGVVAAWHVMDRTPQALAWMSVGGPTLDLDIRASEGGDDVLPAEREAAFRAFEFRVQDNLAEAENIRRALTAAGVLEAAPDDGKGLYALAARYCAARGYTDTPAVKDKTRGQFMYAVRRFAEYHGDVEITALTRRHLSDFATDFTKLPISSRADVRNLPFRDAVAAADKEGLPRVRERTRDQNVTLLKALSAFATEEGLIPVNPWAGYTSPKTRSKISATQQDKRHTFTSAEVKTIVADALKLDPQTIDYWAPIIGAHHGLRIEEIAQLRVDDVLVKDGLDCIRITDAGEGQKIKNKNTLRTIPLHSGVLDAGFIEFVTGRRQARASTLFMVAERWGGALKEIRPDGQGRYSTTYISRFGRQLERLGITGEKVGTHSFRHFWTDLARETGIPEGHRVALAGRGPGDPVEAAYGKGYSMAALKESLEKLRPLD